jgi:PAS domain S-box-containing protein
MRLSATRAVMLMAVLFLLLLAAGDGVLLWLQHQSRLDEATQDAANLTIVLEQHVRQMFNNLDGLLQDYIELTTDHGRSPAGNTLSPFIFHRSDLVEALRMYGVDGRLRTASVYSGPEAQDWSHQEAFKHPRDTPRDGLFVGKPILEDGVWRYPLSRRISSEDGHFQGVAVLLANIESFSGFFSTLYLGEHGSVGILRRDGEFIARYPVPASGPGLSVALSPLFKNQIAPLSEGMASGISSIDGQMRIGHFRSVSGLPLVVIVFRDQDDALAPWRELVHLHLGILGAVALAVALLVTLIWRQQTGLARAAADVREEQRRLETVTAHLPAVIMQRILKPDGKLLFPYISRGSEEILGMSPQLFASNPNLMLERMPRADRVQLQKVLRDSARDATPINEEFRLFHPDGSAHWLRISARPRRLENGGVAWEGLFLDVTAHKAAVADKQALERRLEAIMDKVPGVVFQRIMDREGQVRYTFISPAVHSLFGVKPEEVLRDYRVLRERTLAEDREAVASSFLRRTTDKGEWNREFQVRGPDGQARWVRGTAIRHETEQGEVIWDGLFLDITMQKAAVAATRALQRRMEAIVAEIPGAVFECIQAEDGLRFSFLSPQTEALFAVPTHEILHNFTRIMTYVVPEDRPVLEARLAQHGRDLGDWVEEFRLMPPGGALRWIRGTARARKLEGTIVVWNGVFQDVTQVKAAEEGAQRNQRNQALAHLTAGVAHEFNNLLTVIQGSLELLGVNEGTAGDLVASAQRAADRGANVTRALQAYARRQALRPSTGKVSEMLLEVTVLLNSILGQSIRLDLMLPEETWPIHVDWDQLGNALITLAVNSKEAMPRGGILRIESANSTMTEPIADLTPGEFVRITVSDSGQGMADDVRRHAFDPFYSTKTVGGGSALGLSTVFGFIKQSRGHVALESREGQGTTVTILLPRATSHAGQGARPA